MATPEATILTENEQLAGINSDYEQRYGFHDAEHYLYNAPKRLGREIVEKISELKSEPRWMRDFRLKALEHFLARPPPTWASPMLAELDYDDIRHFVRASEKPGRSWDDVPEDVGRTFDRLGIPEAERKFLSGVGARHESEVVYHQIHEDLVKPGVIFTDMDAALHEHEQIVHQHFAFPRATRSSTASTAMPERACSTRSLWAETTYDESPTRSAAPARHFVVRPRARRPSDRTTGRDQRGQASDHLSWIAQTFLQLVPL